MTAVYLVTGVVESGVTPVRSVSFSLRYIGIGPRTALSVSVAALVFNPIPAPGIVVGAVHGRRGTRAAARGAPGAAW